MLPVWQEHPAFFRGAYPLLQVFKYSARAEVTHRLIEQAARDGREETETTDRHGGNPERHDPRASADKAAAEFSEPNHAISV